MRVIENHVESCHCWHCGGYGKVAGEVAIPDPIRGGYLQEVMVECEECEGSGEKWRTKATQTAVIRAFLTQTKHALEDIEMNCTYLDKVYGKIDNLIADVEEYERIVGTREKDNG